MLLRCGFLALLMTFGALSPSSAKASGRVAIHFEGRGGDTLAANLAGALPEGLVAVDGAEVRKAAQKKPGRKALTRLLANRKKRPALLDAARAIGRAVDANAVLIGRVEQNRRGRRSARVVIVAVDDGSVQLDDVVTLAAVSGRRGPNRKERAADTRKLKSIVSGPLEPFRPMEEEVAEEEPLAEAPPDEPAARPEDERQQVAQASDEAELEDDELFLDEPGSGGVAAAMIILDARLELGGRNFVYTEPITANLRPYEAFGVPSLSLAGEFYPFAGTKGLSALGVSASYGTAMGLASKAADGTEITTTWSRFSAGLLGRFQLGGKNSTLLGVGLSYGGWNFSFADAGALTSEVPDVGYRIARLGLTARIPTKSFAFLAGLGGFTVPATGALEERFPNASTLGADAMLGAAIPLSTSFEGRATFHYTRFAFDLQPEVGAAYVAGGALDEYFGLQLGAAFLY